MGRPGFALAFFNRCGPRSPSPAAPPSDRATAPVNHDLRFHLKDLNRRPFPPLGGGLSFHR